MLCLVNELELEDKRFKPLMVLRFEDGTTTIQGGGVDIQLDGAGTAELVRLLTEEHPGHPKHKAIMEALEAAKEEIASDQSDQPDASPQNP